MADDRPEGAALDGLRRRQQRRRSVALGLLLAGLVVLFYVLTVLKFGAGHPA